MPISSSALDNPYTLRIWEFLVEYITAHEYPPAMSDFVLGGAATSNSVVTRHLGHLEDAGFIIRQRAGSGGGQLGRGLLITSEAREKYLGEERNEQETR